MAVNFVNSRKVTYTPEKVATTAYDIILSTGYFSYDCCLWNEKLVADKPGKIFNPFFADEHRTWQETQPSSASGMYPSGNALEWKADQNVDTIALLADATTSDWETHSNFLTTTTSLTNKLSPSNKNLVASLKDNTRLERLLGQCWTGVCTSEKMGTGGSLPVTHYCWLCGYDSVNPSFKCKYPKTIHVKNVMATKNWGGSEKTSRSEDGLGRSTYRITLKT